MVGLDNPVHLLLVLIILLLVFGAKRLPEMGRSLGDGLRGFKDAVSGQPSVQQLVAPPPAPGNVAPEAGAVLAEPQRTEQSFGETE